MNSCNTDFPVCTKCKRIVDAFREPFADGLCEFCSRAFDPSVPPLPPHIMQTVEPYILWRIHRALAEQYLEFSEAAQKAEMLRVK